MTPVKREIYRQKLNYLKEANTQSKTPSEAYLHELENDVLWKHVSKKHSGILRRLSGKKKLRFATPPGVQPEKRPPKYVWTFQKRYNDLVASILQTNPDSVTLSGTAAESDRLTDVWQAITRVENANPSQSPESCDLARKRVKDIDDFLQGDADAKRVDLMIGGQVMSVDVPNSSRLVTSLEAEDSALPSDSAIQAFFSELRLNDFQIPEDVQLPDDESTFGVSWMLSKLKRVEDGELCCFLDSSSCFLDDLSRL